MESVPEKDAPCAQPKKQDYEDETQTLLREALEDKSMLEIGGQEWQTMGAETYECDGFFCGNKPCAPDRTSSKEEDGSVLDDEWYTLLQRCIQSPEFLKKLESIRGVASQLAADRCQGCSSSSNDDLCLDHQSESSNDSFVFVSRQDAVEEMAAIVASTISHCPEAQKLTSKELHNAVIKACLDLKQSKLKSAWQWSTFLYKFLTVGYSTFQIFEHPWVVRAVAGALWSVPRAVFGLFF